MKKFAKIALTSAVVMACSSSVAFAKTEGSYAGVSIHKSSAEHLNHDRTYSSDYQEKYGSNKVNLGFDYKYAFNVANKIFVAPGAFYERIGTRSIDRGGADNTNAVSLNNRFGVKVDVGYDINDNTALYFTNGASHLNYKIDIQNAGAGDLLVIKEGETAYFYGFGLLSHIHENVTLGFEYNTQSFKASLIGTPPAGYRIKNQLDMYKFTVAYHF